MKVILPGSYDPPTLGHVEIIKKAAEKYKEAYAVVFINPDKDYTFTMEERVEMLRIATKDTPGVTVDFSLGRVVDYMREHSIDKIVKGYRNDTDLEYEKKQAKYNFEHGGYETEFIRADSEMATISSTAARRAIERGGELSALLSDEVIEFIKNR